MNKYLFPFDKVEKGANIIIYGMGVVGQQYWEQIQALDYCNIVVAVDRNAERFDSSKYTVKKVEELQNYDFDYIVIAAGTDGLIKNIMSDLEQIMELPAHKIIAVAARIMREAASSYSLGEMLQGYSVLSDCLNDFLVKAEGDIHFFDDEIRALRESSLYHEKVCREQVQYFKDYLRQEVSVKKKIVLLRFLREANCFDQECAEMFMRSIEEIQDDYEARCWLLWDISMMELRDGRIRYQDFFRDKRRIMRENIEFFLDRSQCVKGPKSPDGKRIAIIGFYFYSTDTTHFQYMVPYVEEMCKMGYHITLFPIDLLRYRYGECFIRPFVYADCNSSLAVEDHKKTLPSGVNVVYPVGDSIKERVSHFVQHLYAYNPDIIYDFSGEYSYCSSIYYDDFPVVAMQMRGYASSAWFHKFTTRCPKLCIKENEYFNSIAEEQIEKVSPRPISCTMEEVPYKRADYGFLQEDFLIVTSGNRLDTELTRTFVDCVSSFLQEKENARWILVGPVLGDYVKQKCASLFEQKKIIDWGYEDKLSCLYGMCDVYWNPDRNGAAGCILPAVSCGIPIVTTNYPADIMIWIGEENSIAGGYEECRRCIEELYADRDLCKKKGIALREWVDSIVVSGEELIKEVLNVGVKARDVSRKRNEQGECKDESGSSI